MAPITPQYPRYTPTNAQPNIAGLLAGLLVLAHNNNIGEGSTAGGGSDLEIVEADVADGPEECSLSLPYLFPFAPRMNT